jgi:hypothetical protein
VYNSDGTTFSSNNDYYYYLTISSGNFTGKVPILIGTGGIASFFTSVNLYNSSSIPATPSSQQDWTIYNEQPATIYTFIPGSYTFSISTIGQNPSTICSNSITISSITTNNSQCGYNTNIYTTSNSPCSN